MSKQFLEFGALAIILFVVTLILTYFSDSIGIIQQAGNLFTVLLAVIITAVSIVSIHAAVWDMQIGRATPSSKPMAEPAGKLQDLDLNLPLKLPQKTAFGKPRLSKPLQIKKDPKARAISYMENCLKMGHHPQNIANAMARAGWRKELIEEALNNVQEKSFDESLP